MPIYTNTFRFIFTRARARDSPQSNVDGMDAVVKMLKMSFLIQIKSGSLGIFLFFLFFFLYIKLYCFCTNGMNKRNVAKEFSSSIAGERVHFDERLTVKK